MNTPAALGDLLRTWRKRRRISQRELATTADISQRHLSFLESGRAMPSREMVMRLTRRLALPPRERNSLLVAAGFAPVYRERALTDPGLARVQELVARILQGYEPYPALAVDRHWTMLLSNSALGPLLEGVAPALLQPPVNVLRVSLHPDGLASRVLNFDEWRAHVLMRLEAQLEASGDDTLQVLMEELRGYPAPASARRGSDPALSAIAVPLELAHGDRVLRFLSTTTVFGTPVDITLSELAIEAFLPADEATAQALASP
jgi:transcriptional regulator with XRE-family HTH domain